jgi:hypothetical protein
VYNNSRFGGPIEQGKSKGSWEMKRASLISFAVFFVLAGQAAGDSHWADAEIFPQNPTSSDVVAITLSGWWGSSCIPTGSAVSVTDNDIYFDVIWDYPPGIMCATVITPWQQTQSVGPLSLGTYTIYARVIGYPYIPDTYTLITEFTVTDYQFVLSTESIMVPEAQTATFTVALLTDPLGLVEVAVAHESGDSDISVESGASLTFDSSNYSVPQFVTLAAAPDDDYFNGEALIGISALGLISAQVIATVLLSDSYLPRLLRLSRTITMSRLSCMSMQMLPWAPNTARVGKTLLPICRKL